MTTGAYARYKPDVVTETGHLTEKEWLDFRRGGIGGSDVAAVMGVSPFTTGRDLYYDKRGLKPVIDIEDNWVAKEVGHLLEPLVAKIFEKKTGMKVVQIKKMFSHPIYKYMYADVDFFIETADGKKGVLEIKTSNPHNKSKWDNGAIPYNYELQVRHYLAVTDLDFAYIACLFGNSEEEYLHRKIERDRIFEQSIIETEGYFWNEYVEKAVEPPYVENGDMILESIRRRFGTSDTLASEMELNDDEILLIDKYIKLKGEKSEFEKKSKEIDNEMKITYAPIIERLKRKSEGACEKDGKKYVVTYKSSYRTGIGKDNLEKLKINHPAIYEEYVETSESRSFRASIKECS